MNKADKCSVYMGNW